ncbi:MAG: M10 family metallopeptidase C-terminal domain-containing protein [Pseudomonadota bacterium]
MSGMGEAETAFDLCCCTQCNEDRVTGVFSPEGHETGQASAGSSAVSGTSASTNKPSYDWDAAADQITRLGVKWDDGISSNGTGEGTPGVATIVFRDEASRSNTKVADESQIDLGKEAIGAIESVANIDFLIVSEDGPNGTGSANSADIAIEMLDGTNGGWAYVDSSGSDITGASVEIGGIGNFSRIEGFNYRVYLHELLHAVGLSHPGYYNGSDAAGYEAGAYYAEDNWQYSVLSYWDETGTGAQHRATNVDGQAVGAYATGLQLHDIAALQQLYGVNRETRADDSVYGFNSNIDDRAWSMEDTRDVMVAAIWDAGGIDTIDGSGYNDDAVIDLREEQFSSLGGLTYNLSIARDVKIENAVGGSGDDLFIGNAADLDHRDAAVGSRLGYAGNNTFDGRDGSDTVSYEFALRNTSGRSGVAIDLTVETAQDLGRNGSDTFISIENLIGSAFADDLRGTEGDNVLSGGAGDDVIEGRAGADTLSGGEGTDTVAYRSSERGVVIDLGQQRAWLGDAAGDTLSGFENVIGSARADRLTGSDGDNQLIGGGGGDTLSGGGGADRIRAGGGDDTVSGGAGVDVLNGGNGVDTLDFSQDSEGRVVLNFLRGWSRDTSGERDSVTNFENAIGTSAGDFFLGGEGDNTFAGGGGADVLQGFWGDDTLNGEHGADTLRGGMGEDTLLGGRGADDLYGGAHADTVSGGEGADTVRGQHGNDALFGDNGHDRLEGGGNHDRLDGGNGDDTLLGGAGRDIFVFSRGDDTVLDFVDGRDVIEIEGAGGLDDLSLTQDGADVVIGFESATMRLEETSVSLIDADSFLFV